MEERDWKKTKLSLERPYRDDHGERIPVLLDITPDGEQVFETPEHPTKLLGENLRRIFNERGVDFFERQDSLPSGVAQPLDAADQPNEDEESVLDPAKTVLTPEELYNLRKECIPQLFIALGEMTEARDVLSLLLSSAPSQHVSAASSLPPSALTATVVTKPPPISSVEVFNAQLTIGGKDEALRKAANIFGVAATKLEKSRQSSENYWADALKIRRANWGLVPAPLPLGAPTGKGADKTSKDFFISFGLEESPVQFRRRALAHMGTYDAASNNLQFPHRRRHRLRISLAVADSGQTACTFRNAPDLLNAVSLNESLTAAQKELIDEEVFSVLIREASNLPTASTRVSERLIVIDVAERIELQFEMVAITLNPLIVSTSWTLTCDLIYHTLHALLLCMHTTQKSQRILSRGPSKPYSSAIPTGRSVLLQPIIDLLQYQQFCTRIKTELNKLTSALRSAGVPCILRFDAVGETGQYLQRRLATGDSSLRVGGEALLRIDNRQTLRLTFASPSSLTAHLPQATLSIASVPQLCQLLADEAEKCLLSKLCESGERYDRTSVASTWFVDAVSGKTVGRWEGCIVYVQCLRPFRRLIRCRNFCVSFNQDFAVHSSAYRLDRGNTDKLSLYDTYSPQTAASLIVWQQQVLERVLSEH
ncbi:subunit 17 of mediator complex-domain-containing protein [Pisolithus marmoratus]|nr:subunit 17 of mediator complex-domain-containing protein [Pisolithus marmoratus]